MRKSWGSWLAVIDGKPGSQVVMLVASSVMSDGEPFAQNALYWGVLDG